MNKLMQHKMIQGLVDKTGVKLNLKPKGKRLFRGIARSVYEFVHLLRVLRKREVDKRKQYIEDFESGIVLYTDIAKSWVLR